MSRALPARLIDVADDHDRVSFLGARLPADFRLRTVALRPRAAIDYDPADWADALVVVERGELEVECRSGQRARFAAGAVLVVAGLSVRRLRNAGGGLLLISAVSRVR